MWFKCDQALFSNMISLITGGYCSMILRVLQPQSRILVGQAVRSRRNIVLVVFASCITGNSDRLVYLKYIGQVMLDGFKGDKYLGRGGCLASLQTVGIRLETSRVMTLRWLSGSGKEI